MSISDPASDSGKVTINDVARLAGVSKKTVSRVINRSALLSDDTRTRIQQIIKETGFVPNPQARALALRRNFLVGLVHDNPNAQMVLNAQQGILEALHDTEFELLVRPVDRSSPDMLDDISAFLARQRPYGVIVLPPISEDDRVTRLCTEFGCRYVRMGSAELDGPDNMVASNDRDAVSEAVRFLIEQGHERIGLVAGPHGFRSAAERMAGFRAAIEGAGLKLPRTLIAQGNYTFESGVAAGDKLFDHLPRPTAIFASNDEMAAGVLQAAKIRGIDVPEDLSIVGFDDTPVAAHIWPPLTTVRWPIAVMARAAAHKLIQTAYPEQEAEVASLFPSSLIRRSSVAPPRS